MSGCEFSNNTTNGRGGAMKLRDVSAQLDECHFHGNIAMHAAGAMYLGGHDAVYVTLSGCTFHGNGTNTSGGAIAGSVRNLSLTNCTFTGNSAAVSGGAIHSSTLNNGPVHRFESCTFTGNSAGTDGGALTVGVFVTLKVHASIFSNNTAEQGGAVQLGSGFPLPEISHPSLHFSGCDFHANHADLGGAAISSGVVGHLRMVNCIVRGNTAPPGGGALWHRHRGTFDVINCTVYGNATGAFTHLLSAHSPLGEVRIHNSIIWNNGASPFHGEPITVRYSNVQNGAPGVGNINQNPVFMNPIAGNFRLSPVSPCIDAGHNWFLPNDALDINQNGNIQELWPLDFDGNPRVTKNPNVMASGCGPTTLVVDMGAFETAGTAHSGGTMLGDLNGDSAVDLTDLLILLSAWGECVSTCCAADLNMDGSVDLQDLLIVLAGWSGV